MALESKEAVPEKRLLQCPKCNSEFPAQGRERLVHILDTVRANQQEAGWILVCLSNDDANAAKEYLDEMHKSDFDAILQHGGLLTDAQIELLT